MIRPSAVLFDIGNTLLREVRFDLEAGIRAALPNHLRGTESHIARTFRDELIRAHGARREPLLSRWMCANIPDLCDADENRVERAIWAEVVTLEPVAAVRALLDRLQADGVKIGAISNAYFSGPVLRDELERHGLADAFDLVLTSADLGTRKPDGRIFHAALERLGVAARCTWFVGDTFEEDIEGALQAGLVPIWLGTDAPNREVVPPIRHLNDWTELTALYEALPGAIRRGP